MVDKVWNGTKVVGVRNPLCVSPFPFIFNYIYIYINYKGFTGRALMGFAGLAFMGSNELDWALDT